MSEEHKAMSFSSNDPRLREGMPQSLRNAQPLRPEFNQAHDATPSQQHRQEGDGWGVIKRQKPAPELRPKHAQAQSRQGFEQAYIAEHRRAQIKAFEAQAQYLDAPIPTHTRGR